MLLQTVKMETSTEEVSGLFMSRSHVVCGESLPSAGTTLSLTCFSDRFTGEGLQSLPAKSFTEARAPLAATQGNCAKGPRENKEYTVVLVKRNTQKKKTVRTIKLKNSKTN